ncbi:uncharacterized protein PFL1_01423 [Pseudozyma flocculosa PF-1]|uniref:Uncharacterized protein n=1 Tax=Pseudozyma flocculosa TaxID=84751 RepID=A0A5C3EVH4_9BASI|nr:uncharacterized protein PFL1_01423 [Pseudozyma flocculosa PF-1]EPQ31238.1 hypothetical protein PFL1_01423 [Pseudozyma flocculosa PF-1]SPO36264.1 uncharacterized protein PSFLO_01735 [Pseudozyma flocculosa]
MATALSRATVAEELDSWTRLVDMTLQDARVLTLQQYVELYGAQLDVEDVEMPDGPATASASASVSTAAAASTSLPPPQRQSSNVEPHTETSGAVPTVDAEGETLSYVKVKGRGKTKPVQVDSTRSAVSQLFELASHLGVPSPIMDSKSLNLSKGPAGLKHFVTLRFLDRIWEDTHGATSVKAGREAVCALALRDILDASRREA